MKNFAATFLLISLIFIFREINGHAVPLYLCFECYSDCEDPIKVECNPYLPNDGSCYSMNIPQEDGSIVTAKGCLDNDDDETIAKCEAVNKTENGSCYSCEAKLCNAE